LHAEKNHRVNIDQRNVVVRMLVALPVHALSSVLFVSPLLGYWRPCRLFPDVNWHA